MAFYAREKEVELLRDIERRSAARPQLTVVNGRKHVGKTSLLRSVYSDRRIPVVYFYVERKNEHLLCLDMMRIVQSWLGPTLDATASFADMFRQLVCLAATTNFTLIIDECQNLLSVNSNIFNELADIWRHNSTSKRINLIMCGSNHSQMMRLFYDADAPFSAHIDNRISLAPLPIVVLKQILAEHNGGYTPDDLLAFAMITGGVPGYVAELIGQRAFTRADIFRAVLSGGSMFINEGRDLLIEELGRDSQTYFSILYAIASGKATRSDITATIGTECGGYLDKLERIYGLITRHRPYLQPDNTRNVRYGLKDNFLSFWFRYIYRHMSAVEFGDFAYVQQCVDDDYASYSQTMLKKYFRQLYRETGQYDMVVDYWEKGTDRAVDLIAVDSRSKRCLLANCSPSRVTADDLNDIAQAIAAKQPGYSFSVVALGYDDM